MVYRKMTILSRVWQVNSSIPSSTFYNLMRCEIGSDRVTNSVNPDQPTPLGMV